MVAKKWAIPVIILFLFTFCKDHAVKSEDTGVKSMDSASISRWDVIQNGHLVITVFKDSGIYWKITDPARITVDADYKGVARSLKHISKLRDMVPIAVDKSKWKDKGLQDTSSQIVIYVSGKKADSFIIGKLEFVDQKLSSYPLRRPGSDQVYFLKGMYLDGSVLAPFEHLRKRDMAPVDISYMKSIRISTPGSNTYYLLERFKDQWSISGQAIDQAKANAYAKMLTELQIPNFVPAARQKMAQASLLIETTYGPVKFTATEQGAGNWVLASSVNIGNYLALTTAQVQAIFPPADFFQK